MKNLRPHLVATEEKNNLPILIIDKKGFVGPFLSEKLKEQFLVVLVSGKELQFHKNIIHIPFKKRIPVIPDNTYSHVFVFFNGEEEILAILPSLMKKVNSTNGKIFFLTPLHHSSKNLFSKLSHHLYHSLNILIYGEVFDDQIATGNMVNLFIHQARKYERLEIPNEGLGKIYPVFIEDLLAGIIAVAFSHETLGKLVYAFPRFPFTEITVARIFQKINPSIKMDFSKKILKNPEYFIPEGGKFIFKKYDLEDGLRKINLKTDGIGNMFHEQTITKPQVKKRFKPRIFFFGILFLFLSPLIFSLIAGLSAFFMLYLSLGQAEKGEFNNAHNFAMYSRNAFSASEFTMQSYLPADFILSEQKSRAVQYLRVSKHVSEISSDLFKSLNIFSNMYDGKKEGVSVDEFEETLSSTKNSLLRLEELKAQSLLPHRISQKLHQEEYIFSLFENTIDVLPELLGFEGRKKYLILFQNNMELRPGGGFIGSYGLVEIEKGKMGKIEIHDVYDADGKLKTHIEPPYGLRAYGGVSHWFLRDSNFNVDFVTNAAASADILKRATGDEVDGVIAIDTNFIKNILEAVGPVRVNDYNETVTPENFYMLTQRHVEDNFFPGSTQKKDFLRALYNSLLEKAYDSKKVSYYQLAKAIEKSIKQKHLLFVYDDPSIQKTLSTNNLSGVIADGRSKKANGFSDFLASFDANIGANKGNYYIKRSFEQNAKVTDIGSLESTVKIIYENTSTKDSKFGGEYRNYLRFVLPTGANLRTVSVDGRSLTLTQANTDTTIRPSGIFSLNNDLEIETNQVNGKEEVAFFLTVPISSTRTVEVKYLIPQTINISASEFSYDLKILKQPGTDMDPYKLMLSYPSKFIPINLSREFVELGGKVLHETDLSEDRRIIVNFSQK